MTARSTSLLLPPGLLFSVRGDQTDMWKAIEIRVTDERGKRGREGAGDCKICGCVG